MTRTSTYDRDPRVDDYIQRLPDRQQRACQQLRDLIHAADPDVTETIKRTVQPYFILEGNSLQLTGARHSRAHGRKTLHKLLLELARRTTHTAGRRRVPSS
jgi:hypothetical protein